MLNSIGKNLGVIRIKMMLKRVVLTTPNSFHKVRSV